MNFGDSSYLVKLGFNVDQGQFARFQNVLRDASHLVDLRSAEIASSFLKTQLAITGGFSALGAAFLGLADKVAMADQEYRLFGLRMYLAQGQAKQLKIALDALGQPLEVVAWDPELRSRFHELIELQRTLQGGFGPDFEQTLYQLRSVRQEFTKFGVEMQYLQMHLVYDLVKAFGGPDKLLEKLRAINDWIATNLPQISQKIAAYLVPVLKDVKEVLSNTWEAAKEGSVVFTNFIGILSGDTSIEGTTANFDKFATAIQHVINFLKDVVVETTNAEQSLGHFIVGAEEMKEGHFDAARKEFGVSYNISTEQTGISKRLSSPTAFGSSLYDKIVPGGKPIFDLKSLLFGKTPAASGNSSASPDIASIKSAIINASKSAGIDPRLALAVAQVESSFRQFDSLGNVLRSNDPKSHAMGVFQLQPATARMMGVDPTDTMSNIAGGVGYLKQLLDQYGGDPSRALQHYYGSSDARANATYANRVMSAEAAIRIDSLVVNVGSTNATPKDIQNSVTRGILEAQNKQTQRNLAEFNSLAYSY